MRKKIFLFFCLLALICAAAFAAGAEEAPTRLTLYEGPKTMTTSEIASVSVNGYDLFVYDVMVNHEHIWNANTQPTTTPMTYFDFDGRVNVSIKMPGLEKEVESAQVLPQLTAQKVQMICSSSAAACPASSASATTGAETAAPASPARAAAFTNDRRDRLVSWIISVLPI